MAVNKAMHAYKVDKLNCAQSIVKAFAPAEGVQEALRQAKEFGGGRAHDGLCGALYAAMQLAPDEQARNNILRAFEAQATSVKCREIRQARTLKCEQCVELAASLLAQNHGHL